MGFLGARSNNSKFLKFLSTLVTTLTAFSLFGCLNASEISLSQIAGTSKASSSSSASATSNSTNGVVSIAITLQAPAGAIAGSPFSNGITAELRDASNAVVTAANDYVDLSAYTDASCSTAASGTFTVGSGSGMNAVAGVAAFTGLVYNGAEVIYLRVRSGSLTACSTSITVANGPAYSFDLNSVPSISTEIANNQCVGYYINTKDSFGNPYVSGAVAANFSVTGGAGSFFGTADLACAFSSSSTQNLSGSLNYVPFKNIDTFTTYNNKTISITVSGLTVGDTTPTINVRARPNGIAAGFGHTCSILTNGAVQCWGANYAGQIGNGNTTDATAPAQVTGLGPQSGATAIAVGDSHSCARMGAFGGMVCWGENSYGQVGDGTVIQRLSPRSVTGLLGFQTITAMAAGGTHTCASTSSYTYCWGGGLSGQLGDNKSLDSISPTTVSGTGGAINLVAMSGLAAGGSHTCALNAGGTVFCWGNNNAGQLGVGAISVNLTYGTPQTVSLGGTATQIVAGYQHSCALMSDQSVKCWGNNTNLQTGPSAVSTCSGATSCNPIPTTILGVSNAIKIYAGQVHNCALVTPSYTLKCWGYNATGQLGNNTSGGNSNVVNVLDASNAVLDKFDFLNDGSTSTLGSNNTCIARKGLVNCWGASMTGSLGDNGVNTDVAYPITVFKWQ